MNVPPPVSTSDARVALITGAAGGLGRALTAELANQGWRVAAGFHRQHSGQGTELIWPLPLDVTNPGQVATGVEGVLSRWGRLDLLINNAAANVDGLVCQLTEQDWDRVLDVNLKGAFLCAQAVLPAMRKQQEGHVISISSLSGRCGARGQAAYAAAKAGLIGFTQSLAKEVGPDNVRVNAVLPGLLLTPMTAALEPSVWSRAISANALGRVGHPSEVARFIAWLAGTENISGQILQLDSRITAWS
jgi:3-oxoacyl-[acyl-carrier protein] reductase